MRIRATRGDVVEVAATRTELSVLVAAARMALDLLEHDPGSPADGRALLAAVIRDYDDACRRDRERPAPGPAGGETRRPA